MDDPTKGDNFPKDSSLLRKVSLCIECSLSSNTKDLLLKELNTIYKFFRFRSTWFQSVAAAVSFNFCSSFQEDFVINVSEQKSAISGKILVVKVKVIIFCPQFHWNLAHLQFTNLVVSESEVKWKVKVKSEVRIFLSPILLKLRSVVVQDK